MTNIWKILTGFTSDHLLPMIALGSFIFGLYGGWYFTHNHYVAKEAKAKEAIIEQLAKQAEINRKISEDLNTNISVLRDAYIKLGRKSREVKVITNDCSLTPDGVSLWNESLLGKEVLPGSPNGTDATGRGNTPFSEAFENKLLNDERCAINREKINSTKQWCIENFGKERCSH